MIFKGKKGAFIEFKILEYASSNSSGFESDLNWIRFLFKVNTNLEKSESTDSGIMTSELEPFLYWLKDIAEEKEPDNRIFEFFDYYITFELIGNIFNELKIIKISNGSEDKIMDAFLSIDELHEIINELAKEAKKYPYRHSVY